MRFLLTVLIASLGLLSSAHAQSARKLTLQQAVQLAIDNNPDLQKIRQNVGLAKADYLRATGAFLPSVNAGIGWTYNNGSQYVSPVFPIQEIESRSYNWGLSANWNLFNGLSDWKGYEQSEYNLEIATNTFARSAQSTILDVTSNFLVVLQRMELLKIARENLVYQEEQLKKISEMTRLGSRPQIDLYNQQYLKSNAELDVINAEKNVAIGKSQLVSILALDPTQEYDIVVPDLGAGKETNYDLPSLIEAAFRQRPDLAASKLAIKSRQNAVWQAWTGYMPSLDLSWSWGANGVSPSVNKLSVGDQLTDLRSYRVSLNLSIPIFDRFQTNYFVHQATTNLRNAEYDLSSLERSIQVSVKQAYLDYLSYKKSYEVTQDQFKAASLLRETARERYNLGAGTYVELANAVKDFTNAASLATQAKYQYEFQKKVLDFYIGSLKPEDYITIR